MRKQPLEFRKEDVNYVMQRWLGAESCSLVGVGSVGKSNLLQHLSDPEVQTHYMRDKASRFKSIVIDPNLLAPLPSDETNSDQMRCWAGYELMMHRLFLAFYPLDVLGEDAQGFFDTYQRLQDGKNPLFAYMGLRYLELGLEFFTRRGIQIVFMFDEFDEMVRQLPVKFFQTLRGLRDTNKELLCYLTFTRMPLPVLTERFSKGVLDIEPFTELFTDNVHYVGPYNEADGKAMIQRLIKRNQRTDYPDHLAQFLLYASGRYAGLLRAAFMADTLGDTTTWVERNEEFVRKLASRRAVRSESQTIWMSLTEKEQIILKTAAGITRIDYADPEIQQGISMLVQKRLLRADTANNILTIEPPLFRAFVETDPELTPL